MKTDMINPDFFLNLITNFINPISLSSQDHINAIKLNSGICADPGNFIMLSFDEFNRLFNYYLKSSLPNSFLYVLNNPLLYIDPYGLWGWKGLTGSIMTAIGFGALAVGSPLIASGTAVFLVFGGVVLVGIDVIETYGIVSTSTIQNVLTFKQCRRLKQKCSLKLPGSPVCDGICRD